jgi:hypothetical protein
MKWVKNKQKIQIDDWHLWFAWKPVVIGVLPDGNQEVAFFETILRKKVAYFKDGSLYSGWKYKARPTGVPDKPEPKLELENHSTESIYASGYFIPIPDIDTNVTISHNQDADKQDKLNYCEKCGPDSFCRCPESGYCQKCQSNPCRCKGFGLCSNCSSPLNKNYDCKECKLFQKEQWDKKVIDAVHKAVEELIEEDTEEIPEDAIVEINEDWKNYSRELPNRKETTKHEIDIAWEVKHARRNKTIM